MTLNEYQEQAARTINHSNHKAEIIRHALHGLTAEVGELHGIYQKKYQGHPDTEEHKMKECGDILWMLAEYCTGNGWTLDDVAVLNIAKLRERYPDGFDPEKSLHRKDGDI